jgi:hypothetical protein
LACRRYRERLRSGERVARVPYDHRTVDFLIATQWLAESEAGDVAKVADAIARLLAATAKRR